MTDDTDLITARLAAAWEDGYAKGNLDGYFGVHEAATNPYTGVNQYIIEEN